MRTAESFKDCAQVDYRSLRGKSFGVASLPSAPADCVSVALHSAAPVSAFLCVGRGAGSSCQRMRGAIRLEVDRRRDDTSGWADPRALGGSRRVFRSAGRRERALAFGSWLGYRAMIIDKTEAKLDLFDHLGGHSSRYFTDRLGGALAGRISSTGDAVHQVLSTVLFDIAPVYADFCADGIVKGLTAVAPVKCRIAFFVSGLLQGIESAEVVNHSSDAVRELVH
jgi:hypothetical protein